MARSAGNTKEKLVETAISLIWQSSYGSVSVDDICKAADVRKGSFYHYFPSKLELTLAALDDFTEKAKPMWLSIFDSAIEPKKRFINLCDLIYQKQKEVQKQHGRVCGCPFMSLGSEMANREQAVQDKVSKTFDQHISYYQKTIEEMIKLKELPSNIDAHKKASQIYSYIVGHVMMARIQNDIRPLKNDLRAGIFNILEISEKEIELA